MPKIPVIGFNIKEFAAWLVKNKYSKKDYDYVHHLYQIKQIKSRTVVILRGTIERSDWKAINDIFEYDMKTLIVE